jgi:CDP-diacylglycerol--serine O-phosphatidyltransferase
MDKFKESEIRERLYRKRFLIPNAVTVGNLFCGFLAILYSAQGRFQYAIIAIAIAIVLDGLDGRVARKLNASTPFGLEFDSLCDVVSFGVAPAFMVYFWGFKPLADQFGVIVSFLFVLCAATRLARFNVADDNTKGFIGLPTPGAAGVVAATVNLSPVVEPSYLNLILAFGVVLSASYLMVSKIPFVSAKSFKFADMKLRGRLVLGVFIVTIWYLEKWGVAALAFGYAYSGVIVHLLRSPAKRSEA